MRQAQDLSGKRIVTIDEGRVIGRVKDLYLDANFGRLAGIHLRKEGLIRKKIHVIPAEAVRVFGVDVMLVDDNDSVVEAKTIDEAGEWVRLDKVIGREIDTPGGTRIGTVANIAFDEAGDVLAFTLDKVFVDGPIRENRYIVANAVISHGGAKGKLTIDLAKAEAMGEGVTAKEPATIQMLAPEDAPETPDVIETAPEVELADDPVYVEPVAPEVPAAPSEIVIEDMPSAEDDMEPFVVEGLLNANDSDNQ